MTIRRLHGTWRGCLTINLGTDKGSPNGEFRFSVINPWPGQRKIKPLSKKVKSIICEASKLRSKLAEEPLDEMCQSWPRLHWAVVSLIYKNVVPARQVVTGRNQLSKLRLTDD